jgi:hypothetical protein
MTTEAPKRKLRQTIDVEAVSNTPDINAIGYVIGDDNGVTLFKGEWCLKLPEGVTFDPTCKTEFWDKNQGLLKHIEENAKPEEEQIKDFVKTVDSMANKFGVDETDIKNVSDNPEFDYGGMTRYVKKHCNRHPLRYTSDGKYRSVRDLGEATWAIGIGEIIKKRADEIVIHDHYPANDAESIYINDVIAEKVLDQIKKTLGQQITEIATKAADEALEEIKAAREAFKTKVVM